MCRIRERARENLRRYNNVEWFFNGLLDHADGHCIEKLEEAKALLSGKPSLKQHHRPRRIDPSALYTRHDLFAMGLPRRMVNSLSRTATVQRGQYIGSAVIAALESRAAATQDKHPVSFKARRNHNGRR